VHLEIAEFKDPLQLIVKAMCFWKGCLWGKLLKRVKKAKYLVSQEALAGIEEIFRNM
jgi:hypothetical protein